MCICINCRHIRQCKVYRFIEYQHYNKILSSSRKGICFTPINAIIIANINRQKENVTLDWDLKQCSSFIEQPGYWLT